MHSGVQNIKEWIHMDKRQTREYLLKQAEASNREVAVTSTVFPDAKLILRELTAKEAIDLSQSCRRPDGTINESALVGKVLIACLRIAETKELVFEPSDRETLLNGGISVWQPIAQQAMELCGLDNNALEDAKKK
jgi:hypothetical protein